MNSSLQVKKNLEDYIKSVRNMRKKYQYVFIYGAGNIGKILQRVLEEHGINIDGFCVTNADFSKEHENQKPVFQIDQITVPKEKACFLIAVRYPANLEILSLLERYGFSAYLDTPENAVLFRDISEEGMNPILEVTTVIGCSVNCKYCPQSVLDRAYFKDERPRVMSFETFQTCVDKVPMNTLIAFEGFAEAFINPDAVKMMKYVNEKGRRLALYTTLVGMSMQDFEQIKKIPFERVVLHIPDQDRFANIPLNDEYFELLDAMLNTKKITGENFIDKANCQSIPDPEVMEHIKGRVLVSSELYDRAGNLSYENLEHARNVQGRIYCEHTLDLNHNVLLPDGSLVLCFMDFGLRHIIGNLLETSYEDIIRGEKLQAIRISMQDNTDTELLCRNCSSARYYQG